MNIKKENIALKNDLSEIRKIRETVEKFGKENKLSQDDIFDMNLALEEIVVNIISYGYKTKEVRWIKVDLLIDENELILKTEDDGQSFDPTKVPEADIDVPLEKRILGGLGIHIVKNIVDEMEYKRVDNKNIFVMKKNIKSSL